MRVRLQGVFDPTQRAVAGGGEITRELETKWKFMASALEKRPGEEVPVNQLLGAGGAVCAIV